MIDALQGLPPTFIITCMVVLGLLIGSFLNVVIYRLPKKIDQEQEEGVAEFVEQKVSQKESLDFIQLGSKCSKCENESHWSKGVFVLPEKLRAKKAAPFNLSTPSSSCPKCGHKIRWWENIPVISWLFLRGKCSSCHNPISARYPLIELLTGVLFGVVAWHFGASAQTLLWCFFVAMCIAISGVDWDTTWLPDELSLSLMWVGIIAATLDLNITLNQATWGAVAGYLSLWIIANGYTFITKNTAMANGDFKMLAALGAWFGVQWLLPILLLSSIVGAVVGITLKIRQNTKDLREGKYIPFGPFLAGAGLLILIISPKTLQALFPYLFLTF